MKLGNASGLVPHTMDRVPGAGDALHVRLRISRRTGENAQPLLIYTELPVGINQRE